LKRLKAASEATNDSVAERGGFEPPVPARAHVISSHAG
jgi:hypothetical protein